MKRAIFFFALFFLSIAFAEMSLVQASGLTSKPDKRHTTHLFNGKNLDGWYTFLKNRGRNNDPQQVFSVNDGLLCISGKEWGCITSNEEFENYTIVLEYKWGERTFAPRENKARDSGLLLHSTGDDGAFDKTWMCSIECNIIEGGTGDFIVVGNGTNQFSITCTVAPEKQLDALVYSATGEPATINGGRINWIARDADWKDIKNFRGKNDVEKAVGKWNRLECVVENGKITTYLNGKLINRATNVRPSKGRIQIQSEGAEIFFRKVDLHI